MTTEKQNPEEKYTLRKKLAAVGPGAVIVGSFIGPGTVVTATRAGAGYGYTLQWTIVFSFIAVMLLQGMSAKLGIITQKGLAENIVDTFAPRPVLQKIVVWIIAIALTLGGFAYAGGDLTGTSIGLSALIGIPSNYIAPVWGIIILIIVTLRDIKWLEKLLCVCVGFMALVFILTMFVVKPDFVGVASGLIPRVPEGSLIYCLSLIGVSYVLGGFFGWKMDRSDKRFFWTNILVIAFGIFIAATGYNPLSIIIAAQAFNGAVLPLVVITLVYITSRKSVLGCYANKTWTRFAGALIGLITIILGGTSIISLF